MENVTTIEMSINESGTSKEIMVQPSSESSAVHTKQLEKC